MKWKNKTHELDELAGKLLENPEKFDHIYVFGAGLSGSQIMRTIKAYGVFGGFIDNDIHKQEKGYQGQPVYSLEQYMDMPKGFVVAAASEDNISDIKKQLEDTGLQEEADFLSHTEFNSRIFPVVSLYYFGRSFVNIAQISLTERCTLKCRKCAHGCFMADPMKSKDLTIDQVYSSADSFFSKVDMIHEFVLIGGEPLLYGQLPAVVQYIGEKYRKKIGTFSITTNGTVLPDKDTIKMCKEYNVLFRISNYSSSIPRLTRFYEKLKDLLAGSGVEYELGREEIEWMDYGFEYVNHNMEESELIKVFDACKTPCREIRGNRYYFCVMARSVSENMGFYVGENDYLDLNTLQGDSGKKELLEFNLGYSEKGYLDMCSHCHGAEAEKYPIPAAEQAE